MRPATPASAPIWRLWLSGSLAWAAGGLSAIWLDGRADLGSQAMPLVLAAALASVWWPAWAAVTACVLAVLAFNLSFVPPRGSLQVSLHRDVLLLFTMQAVSLGITLLMTRQRRLVAQERRQRQQVDQLHDLSEALRNSASVPEACTALRQVLAHGTPDRVACLVPADDDPSGSGWTLIGTVSADEASGLHLCQQQRQALGPGTGRYDNQPGCYLPLRARQTTLGAVLLRDDPARSGEPVPHEQIQALCDLTGQTLERLTTARRADQARQTAETHALRSTMLAAISHDYRTPLATILGAASSLSQQAERLGPAQRQRLADTIVDEASHLSRLTDNALQLTRLGAAPQVIARDWESIEELVGAVLRRVRARDPGRRVRARLDGALPLLRCDAVLIVQMLENLIDNALKFSPPDTPVEILCRDLGAELLLAVRDRGPGIPVTQRARLFEPFERGDTGRRHARGAGLGLALCQAVARAHGTALRVRTRGHGGVSLEIRFPVETATRPGPLPEEPTPTSTP
jgi:two-component system sensor histidine kinase KdpD